MSVFAWFHRKPPRYPQIRVNVKQPVWGPAIVCGCARCKPPKPAPNLTPDVVLSWEEAEEMHHRLLRLGQAYFAETVGDAMRRARESAK